MAPHHPHPSTSSHLATETALLDVLLARSAAQHRSQLFLQRLRGVLRLSKRVLSVLPPQSTFPSAVSSSNADPYTRVRPLLPKLVSSVIHAAAASSAILELAHFAPLHTLLLASYARILAVTLALGAALGIPQAELMSEGGAAVKPKAKAKADAALAPVTAEAEVVGRDVGEVVARSSVARQTPRLTPNGSSAPISRQPSAPVSRQPSAPASAPVSRQSSVSQSEPQPVEQGAAQPKKRKAVATTGGMDEGLDTRPKKKGTANIDDIFGDTPKAVKKSKSKAKGGTDAFGTGTGDKLKKTKAAEMGEGDRSVSGREESFDTGKKKGKVGAGIDDLGEGDKPKPKKADAAAKADKPKAGKGDAMDDIFGPSKPKKKSKPKPDADADAKKPRKKKKQSAMDAIFGF